MAKNDIQNGGWNYYSLQCIMIMTLISPGDCTLGEGGGDRGKVGEREGRGGEGSVGKGRRKKGEGEWDAGAPHWQKLDLSSCVCVIDCRDVMVMM